MAAATLNLRNLVLGAAADVIFPVLFVALAAISARDPGMGIRAIVAGVITILLVKLWPVGRALTPVLAAAVVIIPSRTP